MSEPQPADDRARSAPLTGITVLDLSQVMAGPWCTQLLGDLGADVIKVESPAGGDQARSSLGVAGPGDNPAFRAVNRNKRSLAVDLKTAAGRALLQRMVSTADVLVESFRPGVAARLGIDAPTLHEVNPRLIVVSLTGFGTPDRQPPADRAADTASATPTAPATATTAAAPTAPPLALRPGYDLIAQAMTGLMSVTGTPGGELAKVGVPITDLGSGLFAVIGILAALRNREATGRGDHVRTSLYQAGLALLVWESAAYWATGTEPGPTGSGHRLLAPYESLRTRNGALVVAANNDKLWRLLTDRLGIPELADDPRFVGNADRLAHRNELAVALEQRLVTDDTDAWVDRLGAAGIPVAPVRTVSQALTDPHTAALAMVGSVAHPVVGEHPVLGLPFQLQADTAWPGTAAPALGQHSREVLRDFGFDTAEIDQLTSNGVVLE
ncbi:CaiB/BaiF CoA transferase family protein [Nakamurella lactea]|uniref:CaiB/BaiF CoA transferase family protein n=1 Tax=Nakamurella lactea TaxID=459515 RepID=UPI0003F7B15D|nr:CoA transferase [Nakamurella lactea]